MTETIPFDEVDDDVRVEAPGRIQWAPIVAALMSGKTLFVSEAHMPRRRIKNLRVAMADAQGKDNRQQLRIVKAGDGWMMWVEPMTSRVVYEIRPRDERTSLELQEAG